MSRNHIDQQCPISIPLTFWFDNPIQSNRLISILPVLTSIVDTKIKFNFKKIDEFIITTNLSTRTNDATFETNNMTGISN